MTAENQPTHAPERRRRSTTALGARILAVQAITLLLLWLLQTTFG